MVNQKQARATLRKVTPVPVYATTVVWQVYLKTFQQLETTPYNYSQMTLKAKFVDKWPMYSALPVTETSQVVFARCMLSSEQINTPKVGTGSDISIRSSMNV